MSPLHFPATFGLSVLYTSFLSLKHVAATWPLVSTLLYFLLMCIYKYDFCFPGNGVKCMNQFLKNAALSVRPDTGAERKKEWISCRNEIVQVLFIVRMTSKKTTTKTALPGTGARRKDMWFTRRQRRTNVGVECGARKQICLNIKISTFWGRWNSHLKANLTGYLQTFNILAQAIVFPQ